MKHSCIRVLLAMVATFDLELEEHDAETNFLDGELEEKISITSWRDSSLVPGSF